MLRWLIGGGREPQGLVEKSSVQTIGEEQVQNPYTELLVLKGHQDIVRFLVQIDDYRFASAGDDGIIFLWNAQTGEKLFELHGHTHKITAIAPFFSSEATEENSHLILTASADRTVISGLGLYYWQAGAKSIMFPFYCKVFDSPSKTGCMVVWRE